MTSSRPATCRRTPRFGSTGGDLTAKQIAEVLGVKTNAVEVAIHRALGRLKVLLEPGEGPPRRLTSTEREALDS